jgi:hypothetical protein
MGKGNGHSISILKILARKKIWKKLVDVCILHNAYKMRYVRSTI